MIVKLVLFAVGQYVFLYSMEHDLAVAPSKPTNLSKWDAGQKITRVGRDELLAR